MQLRVGRKGLSVYRGGNYCGPGWGFTSQDVESGRILRMPQAFDAIDQVCRLHDQCFADQGYFAISCDFALTRRLTDVVFKSESTPTQRLDAVVIAAYFLVQIALIDLPVASYRSIHKRLKTKFFEGAQMLHVIEQESIKWPPRFVN